MADEEEDSTRFAVHLRELEKVDPEELTKENLRHELVHHAHSWQMLAEIGTDPRPRQVANLLIAIADAYERDPAWLATMAGKASGKPQSYLERPRERADGSSYRAGLGPRTFMQEVEGLESAVTTVLSEHSSTIEERETDALACLLAEKIVSRIATVYPLVRARQTLIPPKKMGVPSLPQDEAVTAVAEALKAHLLNVNLSSIDKEAIVRGAMKALGMPQQKADDLFKFRTQRMMRGTSPEQP